MWNLSSCHCADKFSLFYRAFSIVWVVNLTFNFLLRKTVDVKDTTKRVIFHGLWSLYCKILRSINNNDDTWLLPYCTEALKPEILSHSLLVNLDVASQNLKTCELDFLVHILLSSKAMQHRTDQPSHPWIVFPIVGWKMPLVSVPVPRQGATWWNYAPLCNRCTDL